MRLPYLVWNKKHNIAALTISYGRRIWHTREVSDLILGYNAAGRLTRVVMLDPKHRLSANADVREAIVRVTAVLVASGDAREAELNVLRSALERAERPPLEAIS
jgi:hypothetical protein